MRKCLLKLSLIVVIMSIYSVTSVSSPTILTPITDKDCIGNNYIYLPESDCYELIEGEEQILDFAEFYRTPYGKKYHISPMCGGKNSYAVNKIEALSYGLAPCNKCFY